MASRRLSHSPIWEVPRKMPRHAADLAAHCAFVILEYAKRQSASTVTKILVLNCKSGEFAFLILRSLAELVSSNNKPYIFVVSDPAEANVAACRSYFEHRNIVNSKNLEFAVFDPEYDTELVFLSGRRFQPGPTVVVGESLLLDSLRFDIFAMRNGQIHEGLVHIDSCRQWEPDLHDGELLKRSQVKVNFRPLDVSRKQYYTGEHKPLNLLLEQAEQEGYESFCVPVGAADALLKILYLTERDFLLFAIDDCTNFLQLSSEILRRSLQSTVSVLGGNVICNKLSPNSSIICFGKASSKAISAFSHVVGDGSIPDLQNIGTSASLQIALWLLEHSHFDPEVFIRLESRLRYSDAFESQKDRLCAALLNVFDRRFVTSIRCCMSIGRLLMDMKLWEQACIVWQALISESSSDKLAASYFLAICFKNLERFDDASKTIEKSLEQRPFDENFRQLKLELMIAK